MLAIFLLCLKISAELSEASRSPVDGGILEYWCISVVRSQEGKAIRTEHGAILPAGAGPLE